MSALTNAIVAMLLSSTWETNHMEPERHGEFWFRTNIASIRRVTAIVGDRIAAEHYTNTVAMATNEALMTVVDGKVVPVSMVMTNGRVVPATNWHNLNLLEVGRPLTSTQAVIRGLPGARKNEAPK